MWDAAAAPWVESGELSVLGVVQEQHAERARLYAQWKQFNWPIVQDPFTALELTAVPMAVLIDQHGVVRNERPMPKDLADFLAQNFEAPASELAEVENGGSEFEGLVGQGDQAILFGHQAGQAADRHLDAAIASYQAALTKHPDDARLMFRLGVAHRARFDSQARTPNDFSKAVAYWTDALRLNPNQYIWRRRIQQYGPRLSKPYPFYDWVDEAISEIEARGEDPCDLTVTLTQAERAQPQSSTSPLVPDATAYPSSLDRVARDSTLVQLRSTSVPARVDPGDTVRVFLTFEIVDAKWNNEGESMQVWLDRGHKARPHSMTYNSREPAESAEPRTFEFEFTTPKSLGSPSDSCSIGGFAVYNVCDASSGQCLFRRQDFELEVAINRANR